MLSNLTIIVGPKGQPNRIMALGLQSINSSQTRDYHEKVVDNYENPRNVGSLSKDNEDVRTSSVGPYRWPYEKKMWNLLTFWRDPFTKRKFHENSKIIQVDGNICCGKQDFAKRLADELGMKYMPPIDLESNYINRHGYDYRALNPLLPERLRMACDWEMYHENPARLSAIHLQHNLFRLRTLQYVQAIQHLFNTGQGVVLGRSVFTERVFVEAAHNLGWLPLGYVRGDGLRFYDWKMRYVHTRNLVLMALLKPHLTIYLDTPVETCLDRAKNHSDPMIRESKAIVPEFLEGIEQAYKEIVLPKQENNGHLLSYEYKQRATDEEIKDVVDDIKNLTFEFDWKDTKFENWHDHQQKLWYFWKRRKYTSYEVVDFFKYIDSDYYDIAGMGDVITDSDLKMREVLHACHVGPFGWNIDHKTDTKLNPLWSTFWAKENFGEYLQSLVRNNFP